MFEDAIKSLTKDLKEVIKLAVEEFHLMISFIDLQKMFSNTDNIIKGMLGKFIKCLKKLLIIFVPFECIFDIFMKLFKMEKSFDPIKY